MPRNLSAWIDLTVHLIVIAVLVGVVYFYNEYIAAIGMVVWVALASFARDRCHDRSRRFERYCRDVISNINEMMDYAVDNLPQAVLVVDEDGRLQWCNNRMVDFVDEKPEQDTPVSEFWPDIPLESIWGNEGEVVFSKDERYFHVRYCPVKNFDGQLPLMTLYVRDVTEFEQLKNEYLMSRTVLAYIQIDNYDEVTQGLTEAERTTMLLEVNQKIDVWTHSMEGFMRRISDDIYVVIMERKFLDKAMMERFDILDKVRQVTGMNKLPVTLSMGVAVANGQTMEELGTQVQSGLDLALGRGGDQVAVQLDGKMQFFGGRTKAVEKHTRVKARVVAHAIREIVEGSDEVYIMGHHNEDFDCFGAAMGVARMVRQLDKPVHIVLSSMNEGIDKFEEFIKDKSEYDGVFVRSSDILGTTAINPLLFIVDTHIPHLVADKSLLDKIHNVIVIDHHRRSENFIKNPLMVYIEPSSSSTSELVTELLMYFDDEMKLSRLDATALYSGIVVDTKNFTVQTGVRTFDAASYLRRSGADPVIVRQLFRTDYETTVILAKAKARSEYYEGGLIVSYISDILSNGQIIAAQVADSLLRIENVNMSIVCFQMKDNVVGISARSTGDLNVQVIMEQFGGGGHQNVAGAQVKDGDLQEIKERAIEISKKYIEENDKDESDTAAGR